MLRYGKEDLLHWQHSPDESDARWQNMVASMGDALFHDLCSLETQEGPAPSRPSATPRRRNMEKRQRSTQKLNNSTNCHQPFEENNNGYFNRSQTAQVLSEEEAEYEYDDSDEEVSLQPLAFVVDGEPDFESGPPQDGFEYLRRVMWETARCPKVKVAKIGERKISKQTNYMPEIRPIPVCSENLLPSKDWIREFLKDFSDLRKTLVNAFSASDLKDDGFDLPPIRDKSSWKSLCLGSSVKKSILEQDDGDSGSTDEDAIPNNGISGPLTYPPILKVVLRLDEVSRATLLRYHVSWLQERTNLAYENAVWLFALSAVVDCPLDDLTCAAIRDLLRICSEFRIKKEKESDEEELYMLNILIAIAGEYFGQADRTV